jgi:hypothetical protein
VSGLQLSVTSVQRQKSLNLPRGPLILTAGFSLVIPHSELVFLLLLVNGVQQQSLSPTSLVTNISPAPLVLGTSGCCNKNTANWVA